MARVSRISRLNDSSHSNNEDGSSLNGDSARKQITKLENTFQLQPNFRIQTHIKAIQDYMQTTLNNCTNTDYDSNSAKSMARQATASIHKFIKTLKMDRYRFVVQVYLGEYGNYDFRNSSKCLWNSKFDTFVDCEVFKREKKIFAVGQVFCIYLE